MENAKPAYISETKHEFHEWSAASDFALRPLPHTFCFRVVLMEKSEKQALARSLPLVALLILYILSFKYIVFNE